jgi:transcriptional regulator with XRE-family HTH domain
MEGLPERLRRLRKERGLTSTALAQPKYTVGYVSQIERGARRPSHEALVYFARRLGVSPTHLLTGVPDDLPLRLQFELEQAEKDLSEGSYRDSALRAEKVLEECQQYDVPNLSSWAAVVQADALFELDRFTEARERYERLLEAEDLLPAYLARATAGLAKASRALGDLSYAAQTVESLLGTETDPPLDSAAIANLQAVLVSVYFERGDVVLAQRAAERALAALDESTPFKTQLDARHAAARVLAERGLWQEAVRLEHEARMYCRMLANYRVMGKLYIAQAFLCLEAEPPRIEEATAHLNRAEKIMTKYGDESDLAFVWTERARAAFLAGESEESVRWSSLAIASEATYPLERARAQLLRARAFRTLGRLVEARASAQDALVTFEVNEAKAQVLSAWQELAEIASAEGDHRTANEALRAGIRVAGGGRHSLVF